MRLLLKIVGYSILLASLLIAYLFWAEETVIYRCEGEGRYSQSFVNEYEPQLGKIDNPYVSEVGFLKIQSSSKITLLFAEDRHSIWWERPNESVSLWINIEDLVNQLQLKNYDGDLEGVFSTVSKSFSFITNREFEGLCQLVNN
jgi:hypothetical protein